MDLQAEINYFDWRSIYKASANTYIFGSAIFRHSEVVTRRRSRVRYAPSGAAAATPPRSDAAPRRSKGDAALNNLESQSAERQLWCAVIGRAVQDATDHIATVSGPVERQRIREDARAWILHNGLDFRAACHSAGYDPDYLRSRILTMMETVAA